MVEEIFKEFERKKSEILKQSEGEQFTAERDKEILKETVSEHLEKSQPIPASQHQAVIQKAQQIKDEPKERQVQLLVNLAFEKGIAEAIGVAKQLDSSYLIDELHDILVDELYNKLVEQGRLKQI